MESFQVQQQQNQIVFQGVRPIYPTGEQLTVYFTVPTQYKPETGDWIGIYPVGWSSLNHYLVKKQIKPENIFTQTTLSATGLDCKVEFDGELLPKSGEQYYQFVYVKSGEYIRGASTPFMFVESYEMPQHYEWSSLPSSVEAKPLEQVVEREMQKLQNYIFGLEQGIYGYKTVFPLIEETLCEQQQPIVGGGKWTVQGEAEIMPQKQQVQTRIHQLQQLLVEQAQIEQSQRRMEQLQMLVTLKQYERHVVQLQKREQEIREYLRGKMQKQIELFERKVAQVAKLTGECQQPVEQYIRKYEQLLKEKIELDMQKRQMIQHKLRQSIKECIYKLREIQQQEQQYMSRFHSILRQKIHQQQGSSTLTGLFNGVEQQTNEQLRQFVTQVLSEQRKEQFQMVRAQKQLLCLINEICYKLQDMEMSECYTQLRMPRVQQYVAPQQYYYGEHQSNIQQLEQQLCELKQQLRMKVLGGKQYEQQQQQQWLNNGEWIRQVFQKLRELEWNLRQINEQQQQQQPIRGGLWFERRIQSLAQHLRYFEQYQNKQQMLVEEPRLREILIQLRELETELNIEYHPQCFQQQFKQQQQYKPIFELAQQMQTILREKIALLSQVYEQQTPIECEYIIQSAGVNHLPTWRQIIQYERKLQALKTYMWEKQQYKQLQSRLVELEQQLTLQQHIKPVQQQQQQQRVVEQIRSLRQIVEQPECREHIEQQYLFGQKFEKLCQIVNELELSLLPLTSATTNVATSSIVRVPTLPLTGCTNTTVQYAINSIYERFERLVHEYKRQMPVTFTFEQPKYEQIISFLRQQSPIFSTPFGLQQLRERIEQFEQIVCEQCDQQPWNTQLKSILRQVRELKQQEYQQLHQHRQQKQQIAQPTSTIFGENLNNGEWVLVNNGQSWEFESDLNNNNLFGDLTYEPVSDVLAEVTLADLLRQPEYNCEYKNEQQPKLEQFERQMQQIEQFVCGGRQQQPIEWTPKTSCISVEGLIQDLESELVKLRLAQPQEPKTTTTTTTRVVLTTPESVCDEISKFVGQNLLTTVVPTIVAKVAAEQSKQQQQQGQQTTTVFVEPTQYFKVQQQ